jgi:hypothetical protein
VLSLALTVGVCTNARAGEPESSADVSVARDLFRQASRQAEEGKWKEAVELYRRSLALKRAPITLYSLGIALKNTGKYVDAIESLRAFLAEPLVDATRPYEAPAREAISEMEPKIAFVVVRVTPVDGLALRVDGAPMPGASVGARRPIDPGAHEIVATAPGHREARGSFEVGEGGEKTVDLTLVPLPPGETSSPEDPSLPPGTPGMPADDGAPVAAWVLFGVGGAVLTAGVIVGVLGVVEASDAPASEGPEADGAITKAVVGDVLAGTGGIAAGIGMIWLIVEAADSEEEPATAARVRPWSNGAAGGVSITF